MIELFSSDTPNGKKISIMLEEIGFDYKVKKLDLSKGDQFKPEFKKISPFSKIPAIVDYSNSNEAVFESGAILIYLAEKSGKFYDKKSKLKIDQWLMAQMGIVGPFIGQYHYFYRFNRGLSEIGEKRYLEITKSIYKVLDEHLAENRFLAGEHYSISDETISKRPAVVRGYKFMDKDSEIPKP